VFRRWILPVLLILAAGVLGAWAVTRRAADPLAPPKGNGADNPALVRAPRPPEREPPFVVLFGGELGGRLWIPPCSQFRQGGISRIGPLLKEMTERAQTSMLLDLGDMTAAPGEAGAAELFAGLASFSDDGLAVEAVGEGDLGIGLERWRALKNGAAPGTAILCANLKDDQGVSLVPAVAHLSVGRKKVLVAATLSPSFEKDLRAAGVMVRISDPIPVLREALQSAGKADLVILLSHAPAEESREILRAIPDLDIVLTAHAGWKPWKEPEIVDGRVLLAGGQGWEFANGIAMKDMGEGRKPELGDSFSRAVRWSTPQSKALQFHADVALRTLRQEGAFDAILKAAAERRPAGETPYSGPEACAACHVGAHAKWKDGRHAASMKTVQERGFDTAWNCLSCHATGSGRPGGHLLKGDSQAAVTCEACHGPGGAHVAAGGKAALENAKDSCLRCHTAEMTPSFNYEDAWPPIVHGR